MSKSNFNSAISVVEKLDDLLATGNLTSEVRSHLTEARNAIVRLHQHPAQAMLDFVLKNGLPLQRDNLYRYHGVSEPIWHSLKETAIQAAMQDFAAQHTDGTSRCTGL